MYRDDRVYEYMPKQVLNRLWLWVFIWTAAGIMLARTVGATGVWLAAAAGAASLVVLFAPVPLSRRAYVGAALLCLALGTTLFVVRAPNPANDAVHQIALSYPLQRMFFQGYATNTRVFHQGSNFLTFEMHITDALLDDTLHPIRGKALVRWSRADTPIFSGERIQVAGRLSPHLGEVNHAVRGMEDYYRARQVFSVIHVSGDGVVVLKPGYAHPRYWAARLRQWQSARLAAVTPEAVRPFIYGVWLGERSLIGGDEYEQFVRAGTAHVLAVSGVHVAIIAFSLNFLLRMTRMPRRMQLLLLMFGVFLFAFMTGARTPTVRAAIMLALYFAYEWFDREPDSLSVLGLCGFGFLVWNPNTLFDSGFLMSFASVASILLFYPGTAFLLSRMYRIPAASLATTLSVQVFTWPVVAWHFYIVPITGIVANVLVVPLLTVALWLCFATVVIASVLPSVAMIFGYALLPVVMAIQWTNRIAGALPLAYTAVFRPSVLAVVLYGAAVVYLYRALYDEKQRRRNLVAMTLLLAVTALFWRPSSHGAWIDFIDVGHGDAVFVRTPGGATLLVDGGDANEYTDAGARIVAPFLYAHAVTHLDYIVVSHSDRDHIGGLFHIVDRFSVGSVLIGPESAEPNELETAFLERCALRGIPVQRVRQGDIIPAKGATIRVAHPPADWATGQKENDRSLVLHIEWPGIAALLPGDVEKAAETLLVAHLDMPVSILKVPHHGSATSSTVEFLNHITPDVAVVSVRAADGRGSFMKDAMVERYHDLGIPLFRTDWHGGVRITSQGGSLSVSAARDARGYSLEPKRK